jgi:hypothetical protein
MAFEITVTERDLAPVDHPAATKCKCKCGDSGGGSVLFSPDVGEAGGAAPDGPGSLSPLGDESGL